MAGGAERPAVRTFDLFTHGMMRPHGPHWPEIWHVDETPVEGYDGLFDDLGLVPTRQGL